MVGQIDSVERMYRSIRILLTATTHTSGNSSLGSAETIIIYRIVQLRAKHYFVAVPTFLYWIFRQGASILVSIFAKNVFIEIWLGEFAKDEFASGILTTLFLYHYGKQELSQPKAKAQSSNLFWKRYYDEILAHYVHCHLIICSAVIVHADHLYINLIYYRWVTPSHAWIQPNNYFRNSFKFKLQLLFIALLHDKSDHKQCNRI